MQTEYCQSRKDAVCKKTRIPFINEWEDAILEAREDAFIKQGGCCLSSKGAHHSREPFLKWGRTLFEEAIHQPGRKDVFIKKGSWLSMREGAGCRWGRKLAVNEGGSWLSTREGAVCQQGRELVVNKGGGCLSMREGAGCQRGRELFVNESGSHLSLREAPVLQKRTPFMDKGGRTLFFNGGRALFIDERWGCHSSREGGHCSSSGGGCHLSRKDTVCRAGCCLSREDTVCWGREDTVHQGRDTVCQWGIEDTVSWWGRVPFVEDKLKNVVGRKDLGRTITFNIGKFKVQHNHMMLEFQRTWTKSCVSLLDVVHSAVTVLSQNTWHSRWAYTLGK